MKSIYEALKARAGELPGYMAPDEEVSALEKHVREPAVGWLCRIYRELPVYAVSLEFQVDGAGRPRAPDSEFANKYDPDRDHIVVWTQACHILYALFDAPPAAAVFAAGFVEVGDSGWGGDRYFVRYRTAAEPPVPLYRVYFDWVNLERDPSLPPEGIHVVSPSFEEVIRVARLTRAWQTPSDPWPVRPTLP